MSITRPEGGWNITRAPVHPGEMLREDFMKPLGISINGRLAGGFDDGLIAESDEPFVSVGIGHLDAVRRNESVKRAGGLERYTLHLHARHPLVLQALWFALYGLLISALLHHLGFKSERQLKK